MPTKIETETQLARLLGNTPIQVELELMQMKNHKSKNVSQEHMLKFYQTFDAFKDRYFDGMVITGAPLEHLEFEEVDYWDELCEIMEWSKTHVHSTFHICWGAQAGLYRATPPLGSGQRKAPAARAAGQTPPSPPNTPICRPRRSARPRTGRRIRFVRRSAGEWRR